MTENDWAIDALEWALCGEAYPVTPEDHEEGGNLAARPKSAGRWRARHFEPKKSQYDQE